jgi:hypothetical protein
VEAKVAFIHILILAAIGVPFAFLWILLVRASVRGGCGTSSCRLLKHQAKGEPEEPKDG